MKQLKATMIRDPTLAIIIASRNHGKLSVHNEALIFLTALLNAAGIEQLNYDHVQLAVPRAQIELEYKGHRYDIAYLDRNGNRILLEIRTEERRKT